MTHRLTTNYAKNYCNRTLIVKVIVENVVTCFLGGHGVVTAGKNCFQVSSKTIEGVGISQFVWQQVPDCRASVIKSPTGVRAKSAARNSETSTDLRG